MDQEPPIVEMGAYQLHFESGATIGERFEVTARIELRETIEVREAAFAKFVEMIDGRDDITRTYLSDEYLLGFLRVCKFYPESAFKRLLASMAFKDKYPKYCENLSPLEEKNVFTHNIFTVLPNRDQHGRRILLIEAGAKWNPKRVSLVEIVRGVMMVVEAALLEPHTQICGATIVIDTDGLSMSHVWQFSPGFAKMLLDWVQEAVPCRVKAVHIVNQPYIFNMVFSIFKPFIGEKLRNRVIQIIYDQLYTELEQGYNIIVCGIFFHGSKRDSLAEHVDPKCLPTQYGGTMVLETIYGDNLHGVLCHFADKFDIVNERRLLKSKKNGRK